MLRSIPLPIQLMPLKKSLTDTSMAPRHFIIVSIAALLLSGCDNGGAGAGAVSEGEARALDEAAKMLDEKRLPEGALPAVTLPDVTPPVETGNEVDDAQSANAAE